MPWLQTPADPFWVGVIIGALLVLDALALYS